jgi:hypothetical protein
MSALPILTRGLITPPTSVEYNVVLPLDVTAQTTEMAVTMPDEIEVAVSLPDDIEVEAVLAELETTIDVPELEVSIELEE